MIASKKDCFMNQWLYGFTMIIQGMSIKYWQGIDNSVITTENRDGVNPNLEDLEKATTNAVHLLVALLGMNSIYIIR